MSDERPWIEGKSFHVLTGSPEEVQSEVNRLLREDRLVWTADGSPIMQMAVSESGERLAVVVECIDREALR